MFCFKTNSLVYPVVLVAANVECLITKFFLVYLYIFCYFFDIFVFNNIRAVQY